MQIAPDLVSQLLAGIDPVVTGGVTFTWTDHTVVLTATDGKLAVGHTEGDITP